MNLRGLGCVLVFAGLSLLAASELRSSRRLAALDAALAKLRQPLVYSVARDQPPRLVHVTELLHSASPLRDSELGIEVDAIRLARRVWVYQWSETRIVSRGPQEHFSTFYGLGWSDELIPSKSFLRKAGHENPLSMPLEAMTFNATELLLGSHKVAAEQFTISDRTRPVSILADDLKKLDPLWAKRLKLDGGSLFACARKNEFTPGDFYISYDAALPDEVSVIAEERGSELVPWSSDGVELFLVQEGLVAFEVMINDAAVESRGANHAVRILSAALVMMGVLLMRRVREAQEAP